MVEVESIGVHKVDHRKKTNSFEDSKQRKSYSSVLLTVPVKYLDNSLWNKAAGKKDDNTINKEDTAPHDRFWWRNDNNDDEIDRDLDRHDILIKQTEHTTPYKSVLLMPNSLKDYRHTHSTELYLIIHPTTQEN